MTEIDRVYENLLNRIISLELEPGALVTQAYLSELLDCGRTPLREAIQRLMVEGLVVHTPNRGISVAPLDIRHYAQIEEAYLFLNAQTVRLAALRRSEAHLRGLEAILESAVEILGQERFLDIAPLDVRFHCLLAEAGRNPFLADAAARMEKLAMRFVAFAYISDSAEVHRQVWSYHQKMVDAVREQDPDGAEEAFRAHMHIARDRLFGALGASQAEQTTAGGVKVWV